MMLKNRKHELFAGFYAKTGNARQAYIDAGYSPNGADASASKLLKTTKVAARIAEIRGNIAKVVQEKTGIDKAWVTTQLVEVVRMAKAAEPVLDHEGSQIGEYRQNLAAANKALELLGKEIGMFVDRKEIRTGSLLDEIPHEELKQLEEMLRGNNRGTTQAITAIPSRTTH